MGGILYRNDNLSDKVVFAMMREHKRQNYSCDYPVIKHEMMFPTRCHCPFGLLVVIMESIIVPNISFLTSNYYEEKYLSATSDYTAFTIAIGWLFCTASSRIDIHPHARSHIVPRHGSEPNACIRNDNARDYL